MIQTNQINILKLLPKQSQPRPDIGSMLAAARAQVAAASAAAAENAQQNAAQNAMDADSAANTQVTTPPGTIDGETVAENIVSVDQQPSAGNPDSDPPTRGTTVDSFTNDYFSTKQNKTNQIRRDKNNVKNPADVSITSKKLPEVVKANINPQPTAAQFGNFRRYNKNGIFYKSNLSAVMKRDNRGSVILNIGNK